MKRYSTIWRWHFYAGLLITPIMLVMAITGGIYLYQNEIENALYSDIFLNDQATTNSSFDHDAIIASAMANKEAPKLKAYKPAYEATDNAHVTLQLADHQQVTVLVDPHSLAIAGQINDDWRLTAMAKKIHGGLMAGTFGEVVVELVACWTIIMVVSGLYLWWPRMRSLWGVILPRLNQSSRIAWRDLHAIPGFVLSIWILVIISTGLPWSVVWGDLLDRFAISINEEFPQEIFSQRPQSVVSAARQTVSMNQLIDIAHQNGFHHGFEIQAPWGEKGSFAIMLGHHGSLAKDTRYTFVDQHSGKILLEVEWQDIGVVGKATSIGISLHEGRLFGPLNQFMNLLAVIALIWLGISGTVMWLKRKPTGSMGAPKSVIKISESRWLMVTVISLGFVLPLAGISMLIIWGLDSYFMRRAKLPSE